MKFRFAPVLDVRKSLCRLTLVTVAIGLSQTPRAQELGPRTNFIRDAEIEVLLKDYISPILRVAGQPVGAVKLSMIQDRSFNAFVANGRNMFVNTGAIIDSETPNQLIGVLAHETGHISGGHLARLSQELPRAQALAVIGTLLGAGAAVAASRNSNVGVSGAAPMGAMLAGPELAMRSLLSYQRTEEQAADRAAISFLTATKQSGRGMVQTFKRFASQQMFLASRVDKYLLSHPLATERINAVEEVAAASPYYDAKDSPALQLRHDLARAKLVGFTARQDEIFRRYPLSDNGLPARYARAIMAHLYPRTGDAQSLIDGLIKTQPSNPYFWELKGQNLLESGKAAAAIAPLRKAASLAPGQPLLRVLLGHALFSTGVPANAAQAAKELTVAVQRDPDVFEGYLYLAQANESLGKTGEAEIAIAQGYFHAGEYERAASLARRAQTKLPSGSAEWRKAEEIASYKTKEPG